MLTLVIALHQFENGYKTPLDYAISRSEVAKLLIENGADIKVEKN